MTDYELLQKAAKAAGIKYRKGDYLKGLDTNKGMWNPLENDAEAFRLRAVLGIQVHSEGGEHDSMVWANDSNEWVTENVCASTRRAIVRAAATMEDI